jgi:hypothetical protein
MSADFIETFNQGNHPMDTVSLDNIKGGSMAGADQCCVTNSSCNVNSSAGNPQK